MFIGAHQNWRSCWILRVFCGKSLVFCFDSRVFGKIVLIKATETACERVFSAAGNIFTKKRGSLLKTRSQAVSFSLMYILCFDCYNKTHNSFWPFEFFCSASGTPQSWHLLYRQVLPDPVHWQPVILFLCP